MSVISIEGIAYVRFAVPALDIMAAFLDDFGLGTLEHGNKLYGVPHGTAPFVHVSEVGDPAFLALGLRAASLADLERLAANEKVEVEALDAPGGGQMVVLADPDGRRIEVVAGQQPRLPSGLSALRAWNHSQTSSREGRAITGTARPSQVARLGHCVLDVGDFRTCEAWYKTRFGLITSDEIEVAPGMAFGAFLRCDLGDQPTDHHSLFLLQHPNGPGFNHAAFEVADLDDLMCGHDHLKGAGQTPHWGVGRHILGNQVFDYWRDPWGHVLEHWTDGDRLTARHGSAVASFDDLIGVQWGPPMTMPD
jgi:catechol 2,3-dioxygenase-like lactoylglutathione lyase family enzyme